MLTDLLAIALNIFTFVLVARILITWIPNIDPYHPVVQMLFQITEPVLEPARKLIPPIGMIDVSPIVVFFVIRVLIELLRELPF